MRYGIDIGHNVNDDIGAISIKREDELNMEVGQKVIAKLKELGNEVIYCTPESADSLVDSLNKRVSTANRNHIDLFISIHFNAGGGRGTEVYAASDEGRQVASSILKEIATMGYTNRGVKDGNWLYVIKKTNAPAILIECAFVDSQEDMERYNGELMANAIVKGLTGALPSSLNLPVNNIKKTENKSQPKDLDILNLQQVLNRLKIRDYSGEKLEEDGVEGQRTISAVKNFQSLVGITADGKAGEETWKSIRSIISKPHLSIGIGEAIPIKYVQWRTSTYIDGVFGQLTKSAVKNYQLQSNLNVDGIVGPKTWEKLIG